MTTELSELKPLLARLRMPGFMESLEHQLELAKNAKWSYTEFLTYLFQNEVERRNQRLLTLRLNKSGMDMDKTLEKFDFSFNTQLNQVLVRELASCDFVKKKENIFLLGPSGVGKTHIAQALGHEAARRGYDVYFKRTLVLLKSINASRGDGTFDNRFRWLCKIPLLILDDFGLNELTQTQQDDFYELICGRYEKASTIFTSNRDMSEWPSVFTNTLLGSAAVDRMAHGSIKIIIEGKSYRIENFIEKNLEKKKELLTEK